MPQKTSPFLEGKWGWNYGESGWNSGADENWLKFSYLFDANVDAIVSTLPPAVGGEAYFLTTDNRIYFVVDGTYYSTPVPKWFEFKIKSTGQVYKFNGTAVATVPDQQDLDNRVDGLEADFDSLADPLTATNGAALIARGVQVVESVASIRLLSKDSPSKFAFATAHTAARQGLGGGPYWLDASDTTSTDDNGSVIVAADGGRWKLIVLGGVNVTCFGAVGDNTTENAAAFSAACAFAAGRPVIVPRTTFGNRYRATGFVAPLGTIFEYQGGGVITSGDVNNATITYSGAGDAGEHRADTLTKGFGVEINQPLTGTGGANTYMLNRIFIRNDGLDAQTDAFPGTKVDGLIVEHRFGGTECRGGRHGLEVILTQTSPTATDNTDENFVGAVSTVNGTTGDGGTALAPRGAYFAHNFYANLTNSMYTQHVNGCESNVLIDANSSTQYRSGYSAVSAGVKQGDVTDAAYAIGALGVSGAEWKYGLLAGNQNGRNPLSNALIRDETTATTMLSAKVAKSVLYDTDDGRMRISLASSNYYNDNYTIRLGGITGSANTPLLQFQCGATDVNLYAGRILASGGVPTIAGSGQINMQFRQTITRELVPTADATYKNGDQALRWTDNYSQRFRPGSGSVTWTSGAGTPEGVVTAVVGSMYTRTDGGANTTLYIKESGTGNTGWVAK